jgi:hypothetical protein
VFADDDSRRYVLVNPTDDALLVRLTTPDTVIDCDALAFGRIDLDEVAGTVQIETADTPTAITVRGAAVSRLIVNGEETALN